MPASPLEVIRSSEHGRVTVLKVQGRLDSETAPQLIEHCAKVQAEGRNLVLNLAGVTFLGSSGVGALLVLVEQFQQQAGAVHFAEISNAARTVVDLLDLEAYLPVHDTEAAALQAMGA